MSRGSVRRGEALLAGLLRCGHCGRKLHVAYSGANGSAGRYHCRGGASQPWRRPVHLVRRHAHRPRRWRRGDRAPAAARRRGGARRPGRASRPRLREKLRQVELALEQARYEAARARRQYDAVDPDNRLVAGELERRWNERLQAVRAIEDRAGCAGGSPAGHADRCRAGAPAGAWRRRRARLEQPGGDAGHPQADHPHADRRDRRARRGRRARSRDPLAGWRSHRAAGRARTAPGSIAGERRPMWSSSSRVLARQMPDKAIAAVLNRAGKTTGRGNGWTRSRVCILRNHRGIAPYRDGERSERGEVTLEEAAAVLKVSEATVRRLINEGVLPARPALQRRTLGDPQPRILKMRGSRRLPTHRRLRRPPSRRSAAKQHGFVRR